jgi:hypothetical protein
MVCYDIIVDNRPMPFEPIDGEDRLKPPVVLDRRRPGRRNDHSPELIPLLRGKSEPDTRPEDIVWAPEDPILAARGFVIDVLVSIIVFGMVCLALWVALE